MPNLLVLHTSININASATRALAEDYAAQYAANHSGTQVTVRDLAASPVPHLIPEMLPIVFGAAPAAGDAGQNAAAALSDTLIAELEAADTVVIGAPMYNFTVPSTLKAWLDNVIRAGRTFTYAGGTPKGLLSPGKKAVVFLASGGAYADGPAKAYDFVEPYLRAVLGFIGITDVTVVRVENQANPDAAQQARAGAMKATHALAA